MLDQLVQTFHAALHVRWGEKLPVLLARAKSVSTAAMARVRAAPPESRDAEVERAVREAFMTGYRQAYMDGILDFVESASSDEPRSSPASLEGLH